MKINSTTLIIVAAAIAFYFFMEKEKPPVTYHPPVRNDLPPAAQGEDWQKWLAIMTFILQAGKDAYNIINQAIQQGKNPDQVAAEEGVTINGFGPYTDQNVRWFQQNHTV